VPATNNTFRIARADACDGGLTYKIKKGARYEFPKSFT